MLIRSCDMISDFNLFSVISIYVTNQTLDAYEYKQKMLVLLLILASLALTTTSNCHRCSH